MFQASAAERNTAGLSALHVAAKNKQGHVTELLLQHLGHQWGETVHLYAA